MKIILLLLIINLLLNRKPTGYLYCGLFGWVGSNPSIFSRHAFSILGMANEMRGGDSCGVYSNRKVSYGTGFTRDFPTFIKKSDRIRVGKDCVVLGHTRKASIGAATAQNAQPVALRNVKNTKEFGFVLTHNGTLSNHEELAKKHDLDISNLNTDSQILAALMYYTGAGSDILGEYNGAAAVVYHIPGTNTIYLFKGESRSSSNVAYCTEERPLYGYQESDHSFYYSSLKAPLEIIAGGEKDIIDFKSNSLIKITNGKVESIFDIDRSDQYQRYVKPYVYKKPTVGMGYNYNNFDDADFYNDKYNTPEYGYPKRNSAVYSKIIHHDPHKGIIQENFATMGEDMINFTRGRFHLGKNLIHAKVTANKLGLIIDTTKWKKPFLTLYFWEGVLLYGVDQYLDLLALKENIKYISPKHMTLLESSPYPIAAYDKDNDKADLKLYANNDVLNLPDTFNGKLVPIFCNKRYTVLNGKLVSTYSGSTINKLHNDNIEILNIWE